MSPAPENFVRYQQQLTESVAVRPEVLGLMFAGSAANLKRADEFSDQDFYLIVTDEAAEAYRQDLSWLPNHEQILLAPRETEHGLKVLYQDGTMLEFAVFSDSELDSHLAPPESRVVFDRGGIGQRIAAIRFSTTEPFDLRRELELMLSLIHIGIGRYRRGEVIAASQHINSYALNHLLGIIRELQPRKGSSEDALNRFRRFELDYPELSERVLPVLQLDPLQSAAEQLQLLLEILPEQDMKLVRKVAKLLELT